MNPKLKVLFSTMMIPAPLGIFYLPFAFPAAIGYAFMTITLYFSCNQGKA